ncbi:uncharacterized protein LOC124816079 [Hydra vulgaris]|uniref:uncharacterized protein LOC124816079 n=1 Tax=Hydra vulgaris TaxID=6087 RepID=UPI001F5F330C|nr:uncharacterized protein LOC124816079 [Hydra vulgaris]
MSGIHSGVQTRIKEFNLKAIFVPCANHSLNLCGVHAFGSVSKVLKETVGVTVKRLNDTRWSAHHDGVKPIFKHFEKLVKAVEKLCDASENLDTRGAEEVLMTNICNLNFLCFLHLWYHILLEVNHAQKYLQIEVISLEKCVLKLKSLNTFLVENRKVLVHNAVEYATQTCAEIGIDIESRKRKRVKKMMPGKITKDTGLTPPEKLKRTMFECIDHFYVELEKRLTSMNTVYKKFAVEHKGNLLKATDEEIVTYAHQFSETFNDIEEEEMLPEVKRLKRHLKASGIKLDIAAAWTSLKKML